MYNRTFNRIFIISFVELSLDIFSFLFFCPGTFEDLSFALAQLRKSTYGVQVRASAKGFSLNSPFSVTTFLPTIFIYLYYRPPLSKSYLQSAISHVRIVSHVSERVIFACRVNATLHFYFRALFNVDLSRPRFNLTMNFRLRATIDVASTNL